MIHKCRVCGDDLNDDNWSPSQQERNSWICKMCNAARERLWRKENPEKARIKSEKDNRARGVKPFHENKKCSSYLGIHISENVLRHIFNDVEVVPMNNVGFDFRCNKGKMVDSKSSCQRSDSSWKFHIRCNTTTDYFICLAFDNRRDLNPLHIWLLPGKEFNHLQCLSISPSTVDKLDEYKLDVSKVSEYCNTMRGNLNDV